MGQQLARVSPRGQVKRLHISLKSVWAAQVAPGGEGIRDLHEGESRIVCRRALGRAGCSSPAEGGGHEGKADGVSLRQCNKLRGKCELYSWGPEVERGIEPELN